MRDWAILPIALSLVLFASTHAANASMAISAKPTQNVNCASGTCAATAAKATLNVGDLITMLSSSDVTVQSGSLARNIEVDAGLAWTSSKRLTLDAYAAVTVNSVIVVPSSGAVTILYDQDTNAGDLTFPKRGRMDFQNVSDDLEINGEKYFLAANVHGIAELVNKGQTRIALARNQDLLKQGAFNSSPIPGSVSRFEGLGHTISNLSIDDSTDDDLIGLFAGEDPDNGSGIRDFKLTSVNVIGEGQFQEIGGLIGATGGFVQNCTATGNVSGGQSGWIGGLVGLNSGVVYKSSDTVTVSSSGLSQGVGGLVGKNLAVIDQSFANGSVTSTDAVPTGGLVGLNHAGAISNSYATGSVSGGSQSYTGGLVGSLQDQQNGYKSSLTTSYSVGLVSGGSNALVGGLIGQAYTLGTVANNYWDKETSGISNPSQGAGEPINQVGVKGLTTAKFKSELPKGFGHRLWRESPAINNGYPYLIATPAN